MKFSSFITLFMNAKYKFFMINHNTCIFFDIEIYNGFATFSTNNYVECFTLRYNHLKKLYILLLIHRIGLTI